MNTFCIGKYPIGTQYMPIRKNTYVCTITDIHKTYNNNGDLVKTTYVATHEFCGQTITESNVNETTIARGIDNMKLKEKLAFNKEESKESHGPSGPNVDKQYAWPDDVEDDCYHMEEIH